MRILNKFIIFISTLASLSSEAADIRRRQLLIGSGSLAVAASTPGSTIDVLTEKKISEAAIQERMGFYLNPKTVSEIRLWLDMHIYPYSSEQLKLFDEARALNGDSYFRRMRKLQKMIPQSKTDIVRNMILMETQLATRFRVSMEHIAEEVKFIEDPYFDEKLRSPRKFKPLGTGFQDLYLNLLSIHFPEVSHSFRIRLLTCRYTSVRDYIFRRYDIEENLARHFHLSLEDVMAEISRIHEPYYVDIHSNFYKPSRIQDSLVLPFREHYLKLLEAVVPESARDIKGRHDFYMRLTSQQRLALSTPHIPVTSLNPNLVRQIAAGVNAVINSANETVQLCDPLLSPDPKLLPAPSEEPVDLHLQPETAEKIEVNAND